MREQREKKKKVYALMSGGVDSSVAAALLKSRGYDVTGAHLICWDENEPGCTGSQDRTDAERAAVALNIPLEVWDLRKEYRTQVFEYMVDGYRQGVTPNPDVMCNKKIKFGVAMERALAEGADYVATGHYVKIQNLIRQLADKNQNDRLKFKNVYELLQAKDKNKDQSYFLWTLTQEQLARAIFPIGDYLKSEVREIARKFELPNAEKKDSQGLCFVGKVAFQDFLSRYLPEKPGEVVTADGEVVGRHKGVHYYTIGQRRGIGVRGGTAPYYVAAKDAAANMLLVEERPELRIVRGVEITQATSPVLSEGEEADVKTRTRYRQKAVPARIKMRGGGVAEVVFKEPVQAVAAGQSLVAYGKKGEVVAGGIIREVFNK